MENEPVRVYTHTHDWPSCGTRAVLMAERGKGCVLVDVPPGKTPWIYNLSVKPDERGRGVGDALLTQAEAWCKRHGHKSCRLGWSRAESAPFALQWYMRRGYRETFVDGMGERVFMEKTLAE